MRHSHVRAGYSLLEMLAVMAVLAFILGLGGALLLTAMRADQVGAATLHQMSMHDELADQFRADVARATETPAELGNLKAGPNCLILKTDAGHVVYHWHDRKLDRIVRANGQESRRPVAISSEDTSVEFVRPAGDRPIITVRVLQTLPKTAKRTTEISAALGGDER
jgi:prepilin-type N-terminal cleavage/methylation domain-containing protein